MPQDAQDLNAATQMDLSSEHDVFENRPETIESRASDSGLLVPSSACPFDSTVNGLLDLRAPQLLAMLPPLVPDVELCSSMRRPTVPVGTRLSLLDNQAHAWADDEVWWHLSAIALPKPQRNCRPGSIDCTHMAHCRHTSCGAVLGFHATKIQSNCIRCPT